MLPPSHTLTLLTIKAISPTARQVLRAEVVAHQTFYLTMAVLSKQVDRGYFVWLTYAVRNLNVIEPWRSRLMALSIGNLRSLNDLAKQAHADYIIHTGDFGFYDESSLDRIADK